MIEVLNVTSMVIVLQHINVSSQHVTLLKCTQCYMSAIFNKRSFCIQIGKFKPIIEVLQRVCSLHQGGSSDMVRDFGPNGPSHRREAEVQRQRGKDCWENHREPQALTSLLRVPRDQGTRGSCATPSRCQAENFYLDLVQLPKFA